MFIRSETSLKIKFQNNNYPFHFEIYGFCICFILYVNQNQYMKIKLCKYSLSIFVIGVIKQWVESDADFPIPFYFVT